ncbi:MAG: hypothetical protein E6Q97_04285 [Desulfurellales bacterium]|nr:MAG: hypothetical protein E6Q97_04285 [Desulfurellales bacterium]
MEQIVDHGDAHHLAIIKKAESNMARCYLAHCERIAELEAALREIAEGDVDDGGYRRNHISATTIARKVLGLKD